MLKPYRTIEDVLRSPWASVKAPPKELGTNRVLKSSRLEDSIYADLRAGDDGLDALEQDAMQKLATFPALSRDVYQSFYSLMPRRNDAPTLTTTARKFNSHILDHVMKGEEYPTIKSVCEGRELPAYEATAEFAAQIAEELDGLLASAGGEKDALNVLQKLETAQEQLQADLSDMLSRQRSSQGKNEMLSQAIVDAANKIESKSKQTAAVSKLIDTSLARNQQEMETVIARAAGAAKEKAEEVQSILSAWGNDPAAMEKTAANTELLAQVRQSPALRDIAKYLGRFRNLFANAKRNGYAYGRGEKYALELGNQMSRVITSELALLAAPETVPLFLRKHQRKSLKQYQRREPNYKGMGDMIVCLDESGSTAGDAAAWGKAVALTLLEIAADGKRKFALIHFAGTDSIQTDLFLPGEYTVADKMRAAETFLGGGTNFVTPMTEALHLMSKSGFENADVVFLTDGECAMPPAFSEELFRQQVAHRFTVTGILLDRNAPGMTFSLEAFCQNVYRTSELMGDALVQGLITNRV